MHEHHIIWYTYHKLCILFNDSNVMRQTTTLMLNSVGFQLFQKFSYSVLRVLNSKTLPWETPKCLYCDQETPISWVNFRYHVKTYECFAVIQTGRFQCFFWNLIIKYYHGTSEFRWILSRRNISPPPGTCDRAASIRVEACGWWLRKRIWFR